MPRQGSKKEMNYEQAMERLEQIAQALDSSETPIDEAMVLFEEAVKLIAFCDGKLKDIKQRIETVTGDKNE